MDGHRSQAMDLNRYLGQLFDAQSVAVIGASNDPSKWGFGILSMLLSRGGREIHAINRNGGEIQGLKAYRSLKEVPGPVDVAVIVTQARDTSAAMEDCVYKGVKVALIISGGFSEIGNEGAIIERQIVKIARQGGIRFIGPNCMGHFDTYSNLFTTPFRIPVRNGPIAIVTQSGNSGVAALAIGRGLGLGFSKYISSGNEADLHFEDFLEYLGQDDKTKVILGYVEGFREGKRFLKLAREITRRKPIVILKAGRTGDGAMAARSHSAAMSGSDVASAAAFKQSGVIRVEEISDLVDMALALVGQPLPLGRRVGVISMGGGLGVISTDALRKYGLEMARLSPKTMDELNSVLSERWSRRNPIDPGGDPIIYPCIWPLLKDENVDAVMVVGGIGMVVGLARLMPTPASLQDKYDRFMESTELEELANLDRLLKSMKKHQKPVIIVSMVTGSIVKGKTSEKLEQNYMAPYPSPERAVRALARLVEYSEYLGTAR